MWRNKLIKQDINKQRFFVVENEEWKAKLTEYFDSIDALTESRSKFFEEWGSYEYVYKDNLSIIAIKDPRTLDTPKELPTGWRKCRQYKGFVEPAANQSEIRNMLKSFDYYQELPVSSEVLNLIAKMDTENAARVGGIEPNTNNWVGFYNNLSYLFTLGPSYLRYNNTYLMLIPDSTLKIEEIPGLKEINEEEYQKMYKDNVNWFKENSKEKESE